MKKNIPFLFCLAICFHLNAQDTLYFHNQQKEIAKILEISPNEVMFRKLSYLDGPIFRSLKSSIDSIRFANGMKEVFGASVQKTTDTIAQSGPSAAWKSERESYAMGVSDADQYYKGYKGIGTASYISGIFGLYGFPIPLVGSLVRPTNMLRYVPDVKRYNTDNPYYNGFNSRARSIKSNKAWSNYGYGAATTTGIFLVVLVAFLANLN